MEKYFYLEESPYLPTYCMLYTNIEKMPFPNGIRGSYSMMAARVLGLDYADFLRFARDILEAKIMGKGECYPRAYFRKTPEVLQMVKLLNRRMGLIMNLRAKPYELKKQVNGDIVKENFDVSYS